jgi:hypothetical protein
MFSLEDVRRHRAHQDLQAWGEPVLDEAAKRRMEQLQAEHVDGCACTFANAAWDCGTNSTR